MFRWLTERFPPLLLAAGVKAFIIDHPGKIGYQLRHSVVESPTCGDTMMTLRVRIPAPYKKVATPLPLWWHQLNINPRCFITPYGHFGRAHAYVEPNQPLIVVADSAGQYDVMVIGTRNDPIARQWWARWPDGVEQRKG